MKRFMTILIVLLNSSYCFSSNKCSDLFSKSRNSEEHSSPGTNRPEQLVLMGNEWKRDQYGFRGDAIYLDPPVYTDNFRPTTLNQLKSTFGDSSNVNSREQLGQFLGRVLIDGAKVDNGHQIKMSRSGEGTVNTIGLGKVSLDFSQVKNLQVKLYDSNTMQLEVTGSDSANRQFTFRLHFSDNSNVKGQIFPSTVQIQIAPEPGLLSWFRRPINEEGKIALNAFEVNFEYYSLVEGYKGNNYKDYEGVEREVVSKTYVDRSETGFSAKKRVFKKDVKATIDYVLNPPATLDKIPILIQLMRQSRDYNMVFPGTSALDYVPLFIVEFYNKTIPRLSKERPDLNQEALKRIRELSLGYYVESYWSLINSGKDRRGILLHFFETNLPQVESVWLKNEVLENQNLFHWWAMFGKPDSPVKYHKYIYQDELGN